MLGPDSPAQFWVDSIGNLSRLQTGTSDASNNWPGGGDRFPGVGDHFMPLCRCHRCYPVSGQPLCENDGFILSRPEALLDRKTFTGTLTIDLEAREVVGWYNLPHRSSYADVYTIQTGISERYDLFDV